MLPTVLQPRRHSWSARVRIAAIAAALIALALPHAAGANPTSSFGSFSDSGPMTAGEREALRREREALGNALEPGFEMRAPFVSEEAIMALDAALFRYRQIVSSGGWPKIDAGTTLRPGDSSFDISNLRKHLVIEGDLSRDSGSSRFDQELVEGLARFQIRNGLPVTGFVDRRTARALNVPAEQRLRQMETNLARLQELMKINEAERYVLVNVPGYTLQAVERGQLALSSRVVVGRPQRATPEISARIVEVNFYPFWRVPDSIAQRDLIPTIRKDPDYFHREGFSAMPGWNAEPMDPQSIDWSLADAGSYKFKQNPGPNNALGIVRINMPNKHAVYMHDTPLKELFGQSMRAFSSGCVRVQRVLDLVAWLVAPEKGWEGGRVQEAAAAGESIDVKLRRAVPVHFVYLTAWALPNGAVQFRPDIYGHDQMMANDLEEGGATIAQQRDAITP